MSDPIAGVLRAYRQWQTDPPLQAQPEITGSLGSGVGHKAYKVRGLTPAGEQSFVLRQQTNHPVEATLSFAETADLQQVAATAGLAPRTVYLHLELGISVDMFGGSTRTSVDSATLGRLIRAIHALPCTPRPLDLKRQLGHYVSVARARGVSSTVLPDLSARGIDAVIDDLNAGEHRVCHNDLVPGNLIGDSPRPLAIDWEYGALSSPYFDLAATRAGWPNLDDATLLASVFPEGYSEQHLILATRLYALVEWSWCKAMDQPTPPHQEIQALMTQLEASL